jgi:hypothetical protein
MKKIVLALVAIMLAAGFVYAQGEDNSAKAVVGKIANVTIAEPAKGIAEGTVVVVDDTGKAVEFTVTQSTTIVGTTLDAITLNQLKIGEKIGVMMKKGSKEADSIEVKK